jgi:DNA polymerase-1
VDGYSLLFRAYYALIHANMSNRSGDPTSAIFGFLRMLASLVEQLQPTHLAVALDHPGKTFRDELFDQYKAQRKETPPELIQQLEAMRAILDALSVARVEQEGLEADDVIATLAELASRKGLQVRVVTGDRDALQLVDDDAVVVGLTRKGVSDIEWFGEAQVEAKHGIPPARYPDVAVLRGDTSDNLPGVPGIGPKTAAQLISKYGSLESLLGHVEELPEKHRAAVSRLADDLVQAKRLTLLVRDADLGVTVEDLELGSWDPRRAAQMLVETYDMRRPYDFIAKAFRNRPALVDGKEGENKPGAVRVHQPKRVHQLNRVFDYSQLEGATFAASAAFAGTPGRSAIVKLLLSDQDNFIELTPPFEGLVQKLTDSTLIGSCLKELVRSLAMHHGLDLWPGRLVDLSILGYLLDPDSGAASIKELADRYLGLRNTAEDSLFGQSNDSDLIDEVLLAFPLKEELERRLSADRMDELAVRVEIPLTSVLSDMEITGVAVDLDRLDQIGQDLAQEASGLLAEIHGLAGEVFNPNSPKQLGAILFGKLGLASGKKTKTGYSTSASVLESLRDEHPLVDVVLRYREVEKLRNTFYEGLKSEVAPDGRIHATYKQAVARTGRISSEHPNLQNIPIRTNEGKRFREVFVAPAGNLLVVADYSQIELRILAHLSGDANLIAALRGRTDVHAQVAAQVFGIPVEQVTERERSIAKMVAYGLSYGMESYGLAQRLGIETREAELILSAFFRAFPGLKAYREQAVEEARRYGFTTTLLGRRRYLPDLNSPNRAVRESAERQAMNASTQGLAADIFKIALVQLHKELARFDARLVLQIHDEVVVETPGQVAQEVAQTVERVMSQAYQLEVPLLVNVGVGSSWAQAK